MATAHREATVECDPNDIALRLERIELQQERILSNFGALTNLVNGVLAEPPKMRPHWEYGHGLLAKMTTDKIQSSVGRWLLTIVLGAIGSAVVAWALLKK